MTLSKPDVRPARPQFSSGPCAKRPGWSAAALDASLLGRSHRSPEGKRALKHSIELTRKILGVPDDYRIGIVPGSDTGAFELAMWSMLGPRGVDVLVWESFGKDWSLDVLNQLRLKDVRVLEADYGTLPDLTSVDFSRDVLFTWNGTTSGVRVANADWIPASREGLTFVDATSAIFAQPIDWAKADVVTYSWQKVLGGEAAHGMLILSPRAIERLENHTPSWPMPKLFTIAKKGKVADGVFAGETINTPSMLCVADYIDALNWAESVGGLKGLMARADVNAAAIFDWIDRTPWIANLARDPATRSNTSVCLTFSDPRIKALDSDQQAAFAKDVAKLLDKEGVAYDIASYRSAPPGLRIWAGATVEKSDIEALLPWIDWAYHTVSAR